MKRVVFAFACMLNIIWASAQFSGSGTGTESDPYLIFNPIQLNQIRGFLNKSGVYFKLMSDIDMTEWIADNNPTQGWQPVGTSSSPFQGVIDGGGHTISGFVVNRANSDYVGFFASIMGATIKNLIINGTVVGSNYTGGITGESSNSILTNVTFNGTVVGSSYTGGITGKSSGSTFTDVICNGNITGKVCTGGLVGLINDEITISRCTYNGNINGTDTVGGIIGGVTTAGVNVKISSCFTHGTISGQIKVGGIAGILSLFNISKSGVIMSIYSEDGFAGGIIGHLYNTIYKDNPIVNQCFCIGDIYSNGNNVGGIVGNAIGYYDYYYSSYSFYYISIKNSYYSGNIYGKDNVGGIVGDACQSKIDMCYSVGSVSGNQNVGGIAGHMYNYNNKNINISIYRPSISSCVSINSDVNAVTSCAGRIYGKRDAGDIGQTGSQTGNLGLGTCQVVVNGVLQTIIDGEQDGTSTGSSTLKTRGTYQAIGWNFNTDWNILDTECYPYSKVQMAPPVIESGCNSGSTTVTGKSVNGGTVYLKTDGQTYSGTVSSNHWEITTAPLQGGAKVEVYAYDAAQIQSYIVTQDITYAGKGTQDNPYQLYTAADLAGASGNYYYKLMNNIDLTDYIATNSPTTGWTPIGKGGSVMANIDGDGYTISGLWINSTEDYVGLFSNASGATIKNLKVTTASGKQVKGGNYTGGIVGRCYNGTIENCSFSGNIEGGNYTGGIVGSSENSQDIKNKVSGNITGHDFVGGIVGYTGGGSVTKSKYSGNIQSSTSSAKIGGIAGGSNSALSQCFSSGTVSATGTASIAGGVIGNNEKNGSVINSYSASEISTTSYVGGVVGYNFGNIENCYADGNLKSSANFGGGIVGYNDNTAATVKHCVALNSKVEIADEHGWASRVVGGIKNGASTPNMDNYAYEEMIISINGVPMKLYDDNMNGIGKSQTELNNQSTYKDLNWDFNMIWGMNESTNLPYLLAEISDPEPVKTISLDKTSAAIEIGKDITLETTISPEDATNKTVIWKSANTSVATVINGVVTGVGVGKVQITATTTDGSNLTATCIVTVTTKIIPAASISLNKTSVSVEIGNSTSLKASITPDNATSKELNWSSSNNAVATVNNGNVTGISEGTAIIIATTTDGSDLNTTCTVTVKAKPSADTDISTIDNILYFEPQAASVGSQITLSLKMKNTVEAVGFQTDIYLPEGITVATDEDDFPLIELSNARTTSKKTDYFNSVVQSDGALRILCSSTTGYAFDGNEGEVATIVINIPEGMEDGDYPIIMKAIEIFDKTSNSYKKDYFKTTLTLTSFTLGDANGDNNITVSDFTAIANHILGNTPAAFIEKAADVNQDNSISVGDLTGVANIILYGSPTGPVMSKSFLKSNPVLNMNILPFNLAKTEGCDVNIEISNQGTGFSAYQFDVCLPEGVKLDGAYLSTNRTSEKKTDFFSYCKLDNGMYRVVCASTTGAEFEGNNGVVATLKLSAETDMISGLYDMEIKNVEVSSNAKSMRLNDAVRLFGVDSLTGITGSGTDNTDRIIHSVSGMRLEKMQKGVNIVNDQKYININK